MPALLSSIIYLVLYRTLDLEVDGNEIMDHPYPMGALVAAFTFLLSFRANFAYNRVRLIYAVIVLILLCCNSSHSSFLTNQ